ncbi:hypothetical protein DSO57_1031334 [Entomophthora muscae]|uniref:Uncharacterized protein n=1 Tax=Entomophthora muscae TaxID=34485 RepID=A0ACC2UAE1_9FUNG|nr:hypothetical protein DSO57_1031334 [Entomophthora muscae]
MNDDYLAYVQEENAGLRAEVERLKLRLQLLTPDPQHGNKLGYRIDVPKPRPPAPTSHTNSFSSPSTANAQPDSQTGIFNDHRDDIANGVSTSQSNSSNPHAPFISNPEIRRYGRQLILPQHRD